MRCFRYLLREKKDEKKQTILLDDNLRFIKCFEKPTDITIIEIVKSDNIPEDKFLFPDMNFKNGLDFYLNKNLCLAGYPDNINFSKERHISSGKIKKLINNIEFEHSIDTRRGSSGSPICLIDNQSVIGIHKSGINEKKINFGTFFGHILDKLKNDDLSNSFVEINPFKILNINSEKFNEEKDEIYRCYFNYKELVKCNNNTLLAYFILYNSYRYEQKGELYKVNKDHFYYTIMNNLPKLQLFLKNNKLLLYDMDDVSQNLLHLSIIARNHKITEYLLKEGLFLNGAGTKGYWDITKISEYDLKKFDDLLNKKKVIGFQGPDYNGMRPLWFSSKYNLIQIIYEELKKKNLVEKIYDIYDIDRVIGKRIIRKKELYMNKNINKNIKNYIKIYHGTKYSLLNPL